MGRVGETRRGRGSLGENWGRLGDLGDLGDYVGDLCGGGLWSVVGDGGGGCGDV